MLRKRGALRSGAGVRVGLVSLLTLAGAAVYWCVRLQLLSGAETVKLAALAAAAVGAAFLVGLALLVWQPDEMEQVKQERRQREQMGMTATDKQLEGKSAPE